MANLLKYPTVGTTISEGSWNDNTWVNPTYIYADDGSVASVTAAAYDQLDQTFKLFAKGFDFSALGASDTILGVIFTANMFGSGSGVSIDLAQLLDTSMAGVGTNKFVTRSLLSTGSTNTKTAGGSADTWGNSLTASWVKNSNFGVSVGCYAELNNAKVYLDYITLDVYYTPGPLDIAPAAISAVGVVFNPSVPIYPAVLSTIAAVVDPTVVIEGGGVTVTPSPITAVASKAEPTTVLGSITITPSVLTTVSAEVDPTVVLGNITVTPTSLSAVSQNVDPTVVLGSLTITPAVLTTIAAVVDPTIPTGITVTPDAISAVSSKAEPSVVLGSISLTADALAIIAAKGEPTVVINTNITPTGLDSVGDRIAPTVVLGSISLVPVVGFGIADRVNPDIVLGSIILIPSPLAIVSDRATPTVVLGSLSVSNPISSAVSATKGFTYEIAGKRKVKFAKL